jgi:hypothetical protein
VGAGGVQVSGEPSSTAMTHVTFPASGVSGTGGTVSVQQTGTASVQEASHGGGQLTGSHRSDSPQLLLGMGTEVQRPPPPKTPRGTNPPSLTPQ